MRVDGASIKQIAEYFGCSTVTVNSITRHAPCAINHRSLAVAKRHQDTKAKHLMIKGLWRGYGNRKKTKIDPSVDSA